MPTLAEITQNMVAFVSPINEKQGWNAPASNTRNLAVSDPGGLGITAQQVQCASGEGVQNDGTWKGNGVDAHIATSLSPTIDGTGKTFECYVYIDPSKGQQVLFGYRADADNFMYLGITGTAALTATLKSGGVSYTTNGQTDGVSAGWHHFVFCNENHQWRIWMDGSEIVYGSQTSVDLGSVQFAAMLDFGIQDTFVAFDDSVKWFTVYSACISQSRITANYNNRETFYGLRLMSDGTLKEKADDNFTAQNVVRPATADSSATPRAIRFRHEFRRNTSQTHVPLPFNLADMPAGFWTDIDASGDNMVLAKTDGTEVSMELSGFDRSGQTGTIWIKTPTVQPSSDPDPLVLWYGGTTTRALASTTVYSNTHGGAIDYITVHHLCESSGNAVNAANPGTYDGTVSGATQGVDGQIGQAAEFDGVNDYIACSDSAIPELSVSQTWTVLAVHKPDTPNGEAGTDTFTRNILTHSTVSSDRLILSQRDNNASVGIRDASGYNGFGTPWAVGHMGYLGLTNKNSEIAGYFNGEHLSDSYPPASYLNAGMVIGCSTSKLHDFADGPIDEVHTIAGELAADDHATHIDTWMTYPANAAWDTGEAVEAASGAHPHLGFGFRFGI